MAPRRGGSGGSSSSSISSCPGAFASTYSQVSFANDVVFFVVMLGITIAMFMFRKKISGAGKKLISLPFIGAVLFLLIGYACSIVSQVLVECGTSDSWDVTNWSIAISVFINLSYWLLLFVVVYTLPMMLRQQLGQVSTILKIALLVIVGVMGALTVAKTAMTCYLNWAQIHGGYTSYGPDSLSRLTFYRFTMGYDVLYLLSILAAGALALMTIVSLRSRRSPAGDLIGWVVALILSMVLWVILTIVFIAWILGPYDETWQTSAALSYLLNFGQALSFIFILCMAKHAAWNTSAVVEPMAHMDAYAGVAPPQQYGNNGYSNGQPYYYQQVPPTGYNGGVNPIKA